MIVCNGVYILVEVSIHIAILNVSCIMKDPVSSLIPTQILVSKLDSKFKVRK